MEYPDPNETFQNPTRTFKLYFVAHYTREIFFPSGYEYVYICTAHAHTKTITFFFALSPIWCAIYNFLKH